MAKIITKDGEIKEFTPFFKTPNNHDTLAEAERTGTINDQPSMTKQSETESTDINVILRNFGVTGQLPGGNRIPLPPTLDDFGHITDFQTAMNTMLAAKESFMQVPAEVRAQFQNDPQRFVAYVDACLQAGELDQLDQWGFLIPDALKHQNPPGGPPEGQNP